ncbi:MAG: Mov34/MPN/PAD-1 family protein [Pseudomonadales bacterium]|nr:Mov34/MPN/PAD-1 family protein [Pseudomonadales bacterium]
MPSEYPMQYELNGVRVNIHERVRMQLHDFRQIDLDSFEGFGVLVGSKSTTAKEYWIDKITTPMPDDSATRYTFLMKDAGHQQLIDRCFEESQGEEVYLGTWHTHPQQVPVASQDDKLDFFRCIARNMNRNLFFIVVGTEQTKIYMKKGSRIKLMEMTGDIRAT